jgi:hypothetical protein
MREPARFPYQRVDAGRSQASELAYLPITVTYGSQSHTVPALLDSGSTVNVLSYQVGVQLGLVWDEQTIPVVLTGTLARAPARGVILSGQVAEFAPVELAFAWTQASAVPVTLGQINFFAEFDVCFFRSQSYFEVHPKAG